MFQPDGHHAVTCTGACAGTWPPVKLPAGAAPAAGPRVRTSLLGSDPDPAGGRVITYEGWPSIPTPATSSPGRPPAGPSTSTAVSGT